MKTSKDVRALFAYCRRKAEGRSVFVMLDAIFCTSMHSFCFGVSSHVVSVILHSCLFRQHFSYYFNGGSCGGVKSVLGITCPHGITIYYSIITVVVLEMYGFKP